MAQIIKIGYIIFIYFFHLYDCWIIPNKLITDKVIFNNKSIEESIISHLSNSAERIWMLAISE
jgi:hypothetical protein